MTLRFLTKRWRKYGCIWCRQTGSQKTTERTRVIKTASICTLGLTSHSRSFSLSSTCTPSPSHNPFNSFAVMGNHLPCIAGVGLSDVGLAHIQVVILRRILRPSKYDLEGQMSLNLQYKEGTSTLHLTCERTRVFNLEVPELPFGSLN
jgi:hypothetical protein